MISDKARKQVSVVAWLASSASNRFGPQETPISDIMIPDGRATLGLPMQPHAGQKELKRAGRCVLVWRTNPVRSQIEMQVGRKARGDASSKASATQSFKFIA
jgi:hypothetical protein